MTFTRQRRHDDGIIFQRPSMPSAAGGTGPGLLLVIGAVAAAAIGGPARAAEDQPAAVAPPQPAAAAAPAAQTAPPATFRTEDISIGEPISLPFATPLAPPAPPGSVPNAAARGAAPGFTPPASVLSVPPQAGLPADANAPAVTGGNGWLGIAVDDSLVTGRLVVVEVAPEGPAAKAGVRPQDVLLAINGNQLHTSDELAAALAAIAPDQRVKVAVGRDNRVEDLAMLASTRPPEAATRDWQSAAPPNPQPTMQPNRGPAMAAAAPSPLPPAAPDFRASPVAVQPLPAPLPSATAPAALSVLTGLESPSGRQPAAAAPSAATGRTALGVRTVPVNPDVQSRFHLTDSQGAFVIGVVQDLPASKAGVPPGSVIVALDRQPVRSPQDLSMLVTRGPVGKPVTLHYVLPGGESKQTDVVLQALEEPLERALVGDGGSQTVAPPTLQPAPQPASQTSRRLASQAVREQRQVVYPTAPPTLTAPASDTATSATTTTFPTTSEPPSPTSTAPEQLPLVRLESLLRRMTTQMERIEQRLDRLESGR